jgi:hypothetical protein
MTDMDHFVKKQKKAHFQIHMEFTPGNRGRKSFNAVATLKAMQVPNTGPEDSF